MTLTLLYYCQSEDDDLSKQCLLAFHNCCKRTDFRDTILDKLKMDPATFNGYVKFSLERYDKYEEKQDWANYTNACASITAFVGSFPERMPDYKRLIVPLIKIVSSKTEGVRKGAAVLLGKLASNEDNEKVMRANHGMEVLLSLRD